VNFSGELYGKKVKNNELYTNREDVFYQPISSTLFIDFSEKIEEKD